MSPKNRAGLICDISTKYRCVNYLDDLHRSQSADKFKYAASKIYNEGAIISLTYSSEKE
jgi:hypothetical protein